METPFGIVALKETAAGTYKRLHRIIIREKVRLQSRTYHRQKTKHS